MWRASQVWNNVDDLACVAIATGQWNVLVRYSSDPYTLVSPIPLACEYPMGYVPTPSFLELITHTEQRKSHIINCATTFGLMLPISTSTATTKTPQLLTTPA